MEGCVLHLTRGEECMLEGEEGPAVAKAVELLVTLGDVLGAEMLIPVTSAHISGVSYENIGDAGLEWLEEHVELGAKARIKSTLNPAGMDLDCWRNMGIPEAFAEGQRRIIDVFKNMAVNSTCTCTPYLVGHVPEIRSQVAWAESSAVVYSNSAIGARTNRESGPTSLASAITGLAAFYGYRLEENRLPCKIVEIEADLRSSMDYSALGYLTGRILGAAVPYFRGMENPDLESIKALGAACATSGSIALFHGEGVTPEANMMSSHLRGLERVTVERVDLEEAIEALTCELNDPVYCIGCPHCSLKELEEVAKLVKRGELNGRLWVFTSRGVYASAKRKKIVDVIEKAGGRVFRDTCMVVTPVKDLGWKEVATHSFKAAHYLSSMGLKTRLSTVSELVTEALI